MYTVSQVKMEPGRPKIFSLVTRIGTNPQFFFHMQKFTATCFIQGVLSYWNDIAPA